jgi:hypothetical protein
LGRQYVPALSGSGEIRMAWRATSMPTSKRFALGALVLAFTAMSQGAAGQNAQTGQHAVKATPASSAPQPIITLERTACHGQCAEYKLSFYEDGEVVYEGRAGSSKAGRWRATLTPHTISQLVGEFQRIGFMSFDETYPGGLNPSALAITTFRSGSKVKTVTHEVDSPFPPKSLPVLEDRLDVAVQSVDWVR